MATGTEMGGAAGSRPGTFTEETEKASDVAEPVSAMAVGMGMAAGGAVAHMAPPLGCAFGKGTLHEKALGTGQRRYPST